MPDTREIIEFIRNECYYNAMEHMAGQKLLAQDGASLTIGMGTTVEKTITIGPDGTVDDRNNILLVRLRTSRNRDQWGPFAAAWQDMKETAQSHMLKHLIAVLGVSIPGLADWDWEEETPHTRNQEGEKPLTGAETTKIARETKRAATGVASALSGAYPRHPDALGYHLLHSMLGKNRVSSVMGIAGSAANIGDFNLITRNEDTFTEAHRLGPNATVLWFSQNRQRYIPKGARDAQDVITQARDSFLADVAYEQGSCGLPGRIWPTAEELWEAFEKLNQTAVNQYPPVQSLYVAISRAAVIARANPSCTAIRKIMSKPSLYLRVPDSVLEAFVRESEARTVRRSREKTQARLMEELDSVAQGLRTSTDGDSTPAGTPQEYMGWSEIAAIYPPKTRKKPRARRAQRTAQAGTARAARAAKAPRATAQQAADIIMGPARESVARLLKNAVTVESGPVRAALWAKGLREPVLTMERAQDGAIEARGNGYSTNMTVLPPPGGGERKDPREPGSRGLGTGTARRLLHEFLTENWDTLGSHLASRPPTPNRCEAALGKIRDGLPGWMTEDVDDETITRRVREAVGRIVDPDTWTMTQALTGKAELRSYNKIAPARDTVRELMKSNPGAAAWFFNSENTRTEAINHPGQIISAAKQEMTSRGLEPGSWRHTTAMPADTMREAMAANGRNGTRALNAAAKAGAFPGPKVMAKAATETAPALSATYHEQETGTRRKNTDRTLFLMLRESGAALSQGAGQEAQERIIEAAADVTDYVNYMSHEDQEIRSTSWRGLTQASGRWHRQRGAEPTEREWNEMMARSGGTYMAWESLLGQERTGDLTVTPITDEHGLYQESLAMEHCVIGYGPQCARGASRIFNIARDGKRIATGEIVLRDGEWQHAQTRGRKNHQADSEAVLAMTQTAAAYDQAGRIHREKGNQTKQHWYVNLETGEKSERTTGDGRDPDWGNRIDQIDQIEELPF